MNGNLSGSRGFGVSMLVRGRVRCTVCVTLYMLVMRSYGGLVGTGRLHVKALGRVIGEKGGPFIHVFGTVNEEYASSSPCATALFILKIGLVPFCPR